MSPRYLQIDREERPQGSIYRLTVSRPERLNVVDSTILNDLESALAQIAAEERARVVVLCGAGTKAWIAGADIHDMVNLDPQSAVNFIQRLHRVCAAVRELPVPVVARIDGYCLGAGLELAASCDLRVASDDSCFGMPEVQLGIPSVIEAALLPRLIGIGRARDLVLTGRLVGADEALSWGLVESVAPRAALDALVEERIEQILSAGPRAIRQQKILCRQWEELPLSDVIAESINAFSRAFESNEPRIAMERFLRNRRRR
ncbi:MAG: enoyl-CoA hydratase [Acidiferrobacterales bacterium]